MHSICPPGLINSGIGGVQLGTGRIHLRLVLSSSPTFALLEEKEEQEGCTAAVPDGGLDPI